MGIYILVFISLILRLLLIDKPEGLWNDEYVSYMIAATPFADGFWQAVKSQCHMPFYYLYLKFFMTIFGQSDLLLRLTSVIPGVLAVIVMYFCGLEKDKKTGLTSALLTAISSFLIYYSQEVRFYSLLFLFSAMSLLYTLRIIKNVNVKNLILYVISNFLILFTHTIGFVYVFFNLVFVSIFLFKDYKKYILRLWGIIVLSGLAAMPLVVNIFTTKSISQWWGHFTFSRYGFLMSDYFSPVLTNLVNAPDSFFFNFKSGFIIFALTPMLIACFWIIKSLFNRKNLMLFFICIATVVIMTIAAILGKLVFITKYSIEIYPILIYLASIGAMSISNKPARNIILVFYISLNLIFLAVSPLSAFRLPRNQGHKIATDLIKSMNPQSNDIILLQYYTKARFEKYFDFSPYRVYDISKGNYFEYISAGTDYETAMVSGKTIYKKFFSNSYSGYFSLKLENDIFNNLKAGDSLIILIFDDSALYMPDVMAKIVEDENIYKNTPFLFLVFSLIKNQTLFAASEKLEITGFQKKGAWSAAKFTKLNK